ncbi:Target of EGR1 protein 1 [Smittium mucronatum]|uniref:Target of EGR1 protein 1 n=1 Tax=Smittium mucronatum TaxID=133383 RepID=A0A1R0H0H7_9FUNG|nr:Target of EGR1 protein 1 [Smittium mucronatum]
MSSTIKFNSIDRHNISKLSIFIKQLIQSADFISIDTEFTGLKLEQPSKTFSFKLRDWNNRNQDISERYKALRLLATTHSLVSLGISIFKKVPSSDPQIDSTFVVNNFNFILFCQNSHLVSPSSLEFLANNGFDFNYQDKNGIRFCSPPIQYSNSKDLSNENSKKKRKTPSTNGSLSNSSVSETADGRIIRDIILSVFDSQAPTIIHNGLLDLLFLYNSFITELPPTVDQFVADLDDFLGGPIYDTKYRKMNKRKLAGQKYIDFNIKDQIKLGNLISPPPATPKKSTSSLNPNSPPYCQSNPASQSYHSAVFDAYMTGYLFLANTLESPDAAPSPNPGDPNSISTSTGFGDIGTGDSVPFQSQRNKIFLIGKNFPLSIEPSKFSSNSQSYIEFKSNRSL